MKDSVRYELKETVGFLVSLMALAIEVGSVVQLVRGMLTHNHLLIKEALFGCLFAFMVVYLRMSVMLRNSYNPLSPDYLRNVEQIKRFGGRGDVRRKQRQTLLLILAFGALVIAILSSWKL